MHTKVRAWTNSPKMIMNTTSGFLLHQNVWKVKMNYLFILWNAHSGQSMDQQSKDDYEYNNDDELLLVWQNRVEITYLTEILVDRKKVDRNSSWQKQTWQKKVDRNRLDIKSTWQKKVDRNYIWQKSSDCFPVLQFTYNMYNYVGQEYLKFSMHI